MRFHLHALAAALALTVPALGQTESQPPKGKEVPKDTLWKVQVSGLSG